MNQQSAVIERVLMRRDADGVAWLTMNRPTARNALSMDLMQAMVTVVAVSMGAPFWFDVLKRFANLRSAGRSPIEFGPPPQKPSTPILTP